MRSASLKAYFSILLLVFSFVLQAQNILPKPDVLYPVFDKVGLLTESQRAELNQKLIQYSDSTSTEIEVIILPTTGGEDINFLAARYGEAWGIGQKGKNNGVVFMIATKDHTMSIQQGRAIEQYITASMAGQILDYIVAPAFRNGNWYKGIDEGTTAIMQALEGKFKPNPKKTTEDTGIDFGSIFSLIFTIVVVMLIFRSGGGRGGNDDDTHLSRRGRRNFPGGFIFFPGFFGGGSGGSFGGGSFGGGGFGGFGGGGSFGGGGASGGW